MITYVNSVFVSNVSSSNVVTALADVTKGKFIFWDVDANDAITANTTRFKIGMGTGKTFTVKGNSVKEIKWSNIINVDDIKGWVDHTNGGDTEDSVYIDFSNIDSNVLSLLAEGGKRIITRLTYKDLPTRYRKWTESYEYVTSTMALTGADDTETAAAVAAAKSKIVNDIANMINKEVKRARVVATVGIVNTTSADGTAIGDGTHYFHATSSDPTTIQLVAMPYDDNNSVDSINLYEKVRFNVNMYYTDPSAEGWESLNKNYPTGVTIDKNPGKTDVASAKLVRDREAQAMGYDGILNRGEGTWPIIKPAMNTNLEATYNCITLEFENTYRAADDIFRKTKQTVEIYSTAATSTFTGNSKGQLGVLVNTIIDKNVDKD